MKRNIDSILGRALRLSACAALTLTSGILRAQDSEEITELQEYVVEGVAASESVNPLVYPVNSVFGSSRDMLSIPRGVSVISEALLEDFNVDTVDDIVFFSPGAYTPGSYGNATTPNIRGDVAEIYVNGQRRSANEYGVDPAFNGVESINVVRGPGTVTYGPGFYSGGYVNYVSKKPHFDTTFTNLSFRIGTIVPGETSFANFSTTIDHSRPLVPGKLAMRLSYTAQENDTFYKYHGGREDYQDIYLALLWKPNDHTVIDFNTQYVWQAAPQLLGVNRPYNGLVHDGDYLTGEITDDYQVSPDGFSLVTAVTGTVDYEPEDLLLSSGDFSNANILTSQLVATVNLNPEWDLVSRNLVEYVNRRRWNEFSYAEYVEQFTYESRIELQGKPQWFGLSQQIITGFTARYEEREAYMNYYNYYPFSFNINEGNSFRAEDLFGLYGIPGPGNRLFYGPEDYLPETTLSKLWSPAVFWQHDIALSEQLSLLYGVRYNIYYADVTDPLATAAPPDILNDSDEFNTTDFNVSLTYRPSSKVSLYGTYNRTHAVDGSSGGGALMLSGGALVPEDFRLRSELYEGGLRLSLLENSLYLSVTGYRQDRFRSELGGLTTGIRVHGAEFEAVYQPQENFYLLANLAYTDGRYRDSSPYVLGGVDINGLYDIPVGPEPDPDLIGPDGQIVPGNHRISGLSRWTFNSGVAWRPDEGLGARFWARVQSPQNGNLLAQYTIPTQYTLNAELSWRQPSWEAAVSFLNLTDELNWVHNGDEFGSLAFISHELPFRIEANVRFHF